MPYSREEETRSGRLAQQRGAPVDTLFDIVNGFENRCRDYGVVRLRIFVSAERIVATIALRLI